MNKIRLSIELIINNFSYNLILILQLCSFLIFINFIIALNNANYKCYNLLNHFDENNTYIYIPYNKDCYTKSDSYININKDYLTISQTSVYDIGIDDVKNTLVVGYDDGISEALKEQLIEGKWYTESNIEENIINCVIAENNEYEIGSLIKGKVFNGGTIIDGVYYEDMKDITFRVCGYIEDNPYILHMIITYSDLNCDDLFKHYKTDLNSYSFIQNNRKDNSKNLIIICENSIEGVTLGSNKISIINITENKEKVIGDLEKEAQVLSFKEIKNNTKKVINDEYSHYLPIILCFIVISILSIVCLSYLTKSKNEKIFYIYDYLGMRKNDKKIILGVYCFLLLVLTLIITSLIIYFLLKFGLIPWDEMIIQENNYLFTIINTILMFIFMFIITDGELFYDKNRKFK